MTSSSIVVGRRRPTSRHALAEQYSLEYIDIQETTIEPAVTKLLSERFVRRFRLLPVKRLAKNSVLIAIADPTDIVALDNVKLALGINLTLCVADSTDLDLAIEQVYTQRPALRPVDEGIEIEEDEPEEAFDLSAALGDAAPAVDLVNQIISQAVHDRASDIHFQPGARQLIARIRVDGVVRELASVPKAMQQSVISRLKVMGKLDIAERQVPQDGRCTVNSAGEPIDLRIAVIPTSHGEKVTMRILQRSSTRVSLRDLGMSEQSLRLFRHAIQQPFGCVIACGPTGAGKTTTLYAALEQLNSDERIITTIEDPVEYEIAGISQMQANVKRGVTFARGLRTILRSDPDVLLIGEMRDAETAEIAMQAALTGHLVLTTLHSQTAAGAFARLQDMGVTPFMLANAVNCVVSQRLVRKLCTNCRSDAAPTADDRDELGLSGSAPVTIYHAKGCKHCSKTGYLGRRAIYEVLPVTDEIRELIGGSTKKVRERAVKEGMVTLRQDGYRLVLSGETSLEEIRRVAGNGR